MMTVFIALGCGLSLGWVVALWSPTTVSLEQPAEDLRLPAIRHDIATQLHVLRGDSNFANITFEAEKSRGGGRLHVGGTIAHEEDFHLLTAVVHGITNMHFAVPIRIRWTVIDQAGNELAVPSLRH